MNKDQTSSSNLKSRLLKALQSFDMNDMSIQAQAINRALFEIIKNNHTLSMDTLLEKSNLISKADKIIQYNRLRRHIGSNNRTAGRNEVNTLLSSFGLKLEITKDDGRVLDTKAGGEERL